MDVTQLQAVETMLSTVGELSQGVGQYRSAQYQADQLRARARSERSAAAQEAAQAGRQGRLLESRARAAMAGSGASLTGEQSLEQLQRIQGETEFNQLAALMQGDLRAGSLSASAKLAERHGREQLVASGTRSIGTVLRTASKFYDDRPPTQSAKRKKNPYDNGVYEEDY